MAKAKIVDVNEEIKKLVATPKAIVGTDKTLKAMRSGNLTKIFLAKNVKDSTRKDIEAYSKVENIEVIQLILGNDELGTICKKPFSISVLGESK